MQKYLVIGAMIIGFIVYNIRGESSSSEFVNFRSQIAVNMVEAVLSNPAKDMKEGEDEVALCDGSGFIQKVDGNIVVCGGCLACKGNNGQKAPEVCDCSNNGVCICGDDCKCKDCPKHNNLESAEQKPLETPPLPDAEVEIPKKSVKVEMKAPKKTVNIEVDRYTPRWNVLGDMNKALNRSDLMFHLQRDHQVDVNWMRTKSTDDLQMLHDSIHETERTRLKSRPIMSGGT